MFSSPKNENDTEVEKFTSVLMKPKCDGEDEENSFPWVWSSNDLVGSVFLEPGYKTVNFSPHYSYGTAAVRGHKRLAPGHHHYWELKMASAMYGTDIMVGVGTENFNLQHGIHRFCSLLGYDQESWGFSYSGRLQHRGKFVPYGPRWREGCIIGIHLDTLRGTLEFFLNRKPLGLAFTGLQNKELYPIVTSTAARTSMKMISCFSFPCSLQFLCTKVLFQLLCGNLDACPESLQLPPGLKAFIENNYLTFFKSTGYPDSADLNQTEWDVPKWSDGVRKRSSDDMSGLDSGITQARKRLFSRGLYNYHEALLAQSSTNVESTNSQTTNSSDRASHLHRDYSDPSCQCADIPQDGCDAVGRSSLRSSTGRESSASPGAADCGGFLNMEPQNPIKHSTGLHFSMPLFCQRFSVEDSHHS